MIIYTILKTTFINIESKLLKYHCYKNIQLDIFKDGFTLNLIKESNSYDNFDHISKCQLDTHDPQKKKRICSKTEPHINENLRSAFVKRSRLIKINLTMALIFVKNKESSNQI